jgi:hypothetical protein
VVGLPAGAEIAWVVAAVGDDERRCPVEMAEGTFQCLGVFSVDRVWLEIDGAVVEVVRDESQRARSRLVIR